MANHNPLAKHFRQPAIYLKLPSGGKFYPAGGVETNVAGEIPIYPMTAKDELSLNTPDALMNGDSMIWVFKSCCPSIVDPWSIPSIDLDALLIAIRIASYGNSMDINSKCPHCTHDNEHTINLTALLESIPQANISEETELDGLTFKFQPPTYRYINQLNIKTYEERRLINNILNSELSDEEKKLEFDKSFKTLTEMNIQQVLSSIQSITVDGQIVDDPVYIREYLLNASRTAYVKIKQEAELILRTNKLPPIELTCNGCQATYSTEIEFDQSNFFDQGF